MKTGPFLNILQSEWEQTCWTEEERGGDMQAYAYELTVNKSGILTLENLPFDAGDKVEVIIIQRSISKPDKKRYPFWGKPITYSDPTDPVAEADWEALK